MGRGSRAVVVVAALGCLVAAGCGGTAQVSAPAPTSGAFAPQTTPDGSFTLAVDQDPATWNVHARLGATAALQEILDPVWPSVWHTGPDGALHLDTAFVQSARVTATAPETVVYRINPKAEWSDGVPITYRDFVYAWQSQSGSAAYRDSGGAPFAAASTSGYDQISSVDEVGGDPDVVRVIFAVPDPDWQALFTTLVPAHVAQRVGFSTGFTDPVADDVSGGPYLIQSYQPGASLTEVRNPRYWGTPAGLTSVTFRFLTDTSAIPSALAAGLIDGAVVRPDAALDNALASQDPSATTRQVDGLTTVRLDYNEAGQWLRDPAIRQAVSLAVDRPTLIARTVGPYDPTAVPLNNHFFVPGQAGYQDDSGNLYDGAQDQKALQVLQAAGYATTGGVLTSDGTPVTLRITGSAGDAISATVEQAVVAELAAIGIKVTEVDVADLPATMASGDYDLAVAEVTDSPFLSLADARYQTADPATGAGSANYLHFSDPDVDRLLAQASTTYGTAARDALYDQIDVDLWRDDVDLPLFQLPTAVVYDGPIENFSANPTADGPTWNMADWTDRTSS